MITVDTEKNELVGNYAYKVRECLMQGMPTEVKTHDFLEMEGKIVILYGVHVQTYGIGFVNLGLDHDTAAFSVESIRRWFYRLGKPRYQSSKRLLITADGGGSNGYRLRTWKTELAKLATELGIEISMCHFPPGTNKWNKIKHRHFSQISQSWRGRPLLSVDVIINLIRNTATTRGLKVIAEVDHGVYTPSIKV